MNGAELIAAERHRQIDSEGWTPAHDDGWTAHQLVDAAVSYAVDAITHTPRPPREWPWDSRWWKPSDPIRDLVKAGALIAAEIDRLRRVHADAAANEATCQGDPA